MRGSAISKSDFRIWSKWDLVIGAQFMRLKRKMNTMGLTRHSIPLCNNRKSGASSAARFARPVRLNQPIMLCLGLLGGAEGLLFGWH